MFWVVARSYTIESQWGNFGTLPAPQGCNFYPILRYGPTEPASIFKCGKFQISVNPLSELWGVKVFRMLSLCVFLAAISAPGANIVPPIAYKSHSTPFPIRTARLTPHSWLCDKNCGGVARRSLVRANSNNNTRMYISRRKCEWCLQWQKTPPGC